MILFAFYNVDEELCTLTGERPAEFNTENLRFTVVYSSCRLPANVLILGCRFAENCTVLFKDVHHKCSRLAGESWNIFDHTKFWCSFLFTSGNLKSN